MAPPASAKKSADLSNTPTACNTYYTILPLAGPGHSHAATASRGVARSIMLPPLGCSVTW